MARARKLYPMHISIILIMLVAPIHAQLQGQPTGAGTTNKRQAERGESKFTYPESESDARKMLEDLGCSRESMAAVGRLFFNPIAFGILVVLFTAAALLGNVRIAGRKLRLNLSNSVIAVSLLLAVFQWRSSVEQEALQHYETEIAAANAAEGSEAVASMLGHAYEGGDRLISEKKRYVYLHLDNLEHALERYRQGFASAAITARAVITFGGHCREIEFRQRALDQVRNYPPVMRAVVASIAKKY
jgi:hypothetical protein